MINIDSIRNKLYLKLRDPLVKKETPKTHHWLNFSVTSHLLSHFWRTLVFETKKSSTSWWKKERWIQISLVTYNGIFDMFQVRRHLDIYSKKYNGISASQGWKVLNIYIIHLRHQINLSTFISLIDNLYKFIYIFKMEKTWKQKLTLQTILLLLSPWRFSRIQDTFAQCCMFLI